MPTPVNTRVTPALHSDNIRAIEGYDEIGGFGLSGTIAAFETAYRGVSEMWAARDTVNANGAWNEERRIVELSKLAERKFDLMAKGFDTALANLRTQIKTYEEEMAAVVVSKAGSHVSAEIRRHVKDMNDGERISFLEQAAKDGDTVSLSAVLGAPSYLSGMNANLQKAYIRQFHERTNPEKAKRLRAFQAAADLIIERGALIHSQLEKAVGATPQKARELRRRHEAATKVLT